MTFFELERICKQRRLKRVILAILLVITFISIGFLSYIFFQKKTSNSKTTNTSKIKTLPNINKTLLTVEIDFDEAKKVIKKSAPIKHTKPIPPQNTPHFQPNPPKQKAITFKTQTLPSFNKCLQLANKYFNQRDYKNAIKWAKNANLQNKTDPKPWILISKSLWRLKKQKKAIEVLEIFYNYTKNKEAKKLLEEYYEKINN